MEKHISAFFSLLKSSQTPPSPPIWTCSKLSSYHSPVLTRELWKRFRTEWWLITWQLCTRRPAPWWARRGPETSPTCTPCCGRSPMGSQCLFTMSRITSSSRDFKLLPVSKEIMWGILLVVVLLRKRIMLESQCFSSLYCSIDIWIKYELTCVNLYLI